jgi:hypothetical protein
MKMKTRTTIPSSVAEPRRAPLSAAYRSFIEHMQLTGDEYRVIQESGYKL